jgi:hypothetical protein
MMPNATGVNVSALFRNHLNEAGVNWKKCEEAGEKFDQALIDAEWISLDDGTEFSKTFDPKDAE